MKPIVQEFGQDKGILKFFPYHGAYGTIKGSAVASTWKEVKGGKTFIKAGTPYPTNDANCLGYIFHAVEIQNDTDDVPCTYVYEGVIDAEKIDFASISLEAKTATPNVQFYGKSYKS